MSKKSIGMTKCIYNDCAIPENNNCYWWQLGFIVFGIIGFVLKGNDFSFFNVFLFLFPILLDLFYGDLKGVLRIIKCIYIVVDIICMIVCFAGITMFSEAGVEVIADTLYWGRIDISVVKKMMLYVLVANIPIPIMFYIGRPCKKTMDRVKLILRCETKVREERKAC